MVEVQQVRQPCVILKQNSVAVGRGLRLFIDVMVIKFIALVGGQEVDLRLIVIGIFGSQVQDLGLAHWQLNRHLPSFS